jgi:hypothetical protein
MDAICWHSGNVSSRAVSPVFAGREAEMAVLAGAFEDAASGIPGAVLVGAEAGGGKSRLVAEFAAPLSGRALVLAGGCVELGAAGLPYAPFTAALRQLVHERGAAEVAAYWADGGPVSWPGCCQNSGSLRLTETRTWPAPGCSSCC